MENNMNVPQKIKNRVIISTLGYISGKNENTTLKRSMHHNVHSRTFNKSQDIKVTQVSINRQLNKEDIFIIQQDTSQPCHL